MKSKVIWVAVSVLVALGLLVGVFGCAAPTPAPKPTPTPKPTTPVPPVTLKFTSALASVNIRSEYFVKFEERVTKATNGRILWENYWLGSLVKPREELDALQRGFVQVAAIWANYFPSQLPLNNFSYAIMFNTDSTEIMTNLVGQLEQAVPELSREGEKYNHKKFMTFIMDSVEFNSTKPVSKVADLKGMKVATTGVYHPIWLKAIDAVPISMPVAERYTAFQTGLIDGHILTLSTIYSSKFHEPARYLTIMKLGTQYGYYAFNKDTWNSLLPKEREIIEQLAREVEVETAKAQTKDILDILDSFKKAGVTFVEFPESEKIAWAKRTNGPWDFAKENDAAGLPGTKLIETYLQLAKKVGHKFPYEWPKPS